MGEIKFIIGGTTYTNVTADDQKLQTTIKRDSKLGGFLESQDATLTFIGLVHDYLKTEFADADQNGYCKLIECQILEDCQGSDLTLYNGIIKTSDIEFNNRLATAKTKIYDNSYFALIDNNQNLEVDLLSTRTKNGEVITPPSLYDVAMFNPQNGAALSDCKAYYLFDVLEFVLAWVSDNTIKLQSNLLDTLNTMITDGGAIKTLGNDPGEKFLFTIQEILTELDAKRKIGFKMIVDTNGDLTLQLEAADEFFTTEGILTLTDAYQVITKADKENLFSAVKIGSETTDDSPAFAFPENINLYGFGEEQYSSTGQCNNEKVDSRVSKWVYSSNVIEAQLTGSDDYRDEKFIIESENIDSGALTATAVQHSLVNISATAVFYNMTFNNVSTIRNLYGYVHNTLISGNTIQPADRFSAKQSTSYRFSNNSAVYALANACKMEYVQYPYTPPTTYCDDPFPWDTETNDPNANYDPVAYEYIVPSDGLYNFNSRLQVKASINLSYWPFCLRARLLVEFVLMDSTSTVIKETQMQIFDFDSAGTGYINASGNFNCVATDRVHMRFRSVFYTTTVNCLPVTQPTYIELLIGSNNSYWEMTGGYLFNEINAAKVISHETDYPLTPELFRAVQQAPEGLVTITSHGDEFTGWIDRAEFKHWRNELRIKIKNRF